MPVQNFYLPVSDIRYLLDKSVSIIDREKFHEEISKSFDPESGGLKRLNRIKHTIKINLHKETRDGKRGAVRNR